MTQTFKPEQKMVLRYLQRKGTDASIGDVRRRVSRHFGNLEEEIAAIDAAEARRRPTAGGWCVQEVVDHLVESHRPGIGQLKSLISGLPPGEAIPAGVTSEKPLESPWEDLVEALRQVHRSFLETFDTATDSTSLESRAPVWLVAKCRLPEDGFEVCEWIESLDWKAYALGVGAHSGEHVVQIRRIRAGK